MKIFYVIFLIYFVFVNMATPNISYGGDEPIDVKFCDLVNSTQYQNVEVRVKALYQSGFEIGVLYSSNCNSEHSVWLSLPNENCDGYLPLLDLNLNTGLFGKTTVGLIVVGKLSGRGRYGHLNMYDFEFAANYIEKAEILFEENYLNTKNMSDDKKQKIKDEKNRIEKEWENSQ